MRWSLVNHEQRHRFRAPGESQKINLTDILQARLTDFCKYVIIDIDVAYLDVKLSGMMCKLWDRCFSDSELYGATCKSMKEQYFCSYFEQQSRLYETDIYKIEIFIKEKASGSRIALKCKGIDTANREELIDCLTQ